MENTGDNLDFDDALAPHVERSDQMIVNLEGFEGPLDLLLMLARAQKVDLTQIAILPLVEQYLAFINQARSLSLEVAADYLVMAAWLAYLKSRLLLPEEESDEPSAEEMAMRLQLQLQRLQAMRESGARIMASDRLGRDVFARGMPEPVIIHKKSAYDVTLYELLKAYAVQRVRAAHEPFHIPARPVYSLEDALHRLGKMLGTLINWTDLAEFLPDDGSDPRYRRSTTASLFVAGLELAREGKAEIRQLEPYGPLYLRRRPNVENER
jgi:segregation and condensation protein A